MGGHLSNYIFLLFGASLQKCSLLYHLNLTSAILVNSFIISANLQSLLVSLFNWSNHQQKMAGSVDATVQGLAARFPFQVSWAGLEHRCDGVSDFSTILRESSHLPTLDDICSGPLKSPVCQRDGVLSGNASACFEMIIKMLISPFFIF